MKRTAYLLAGPTASGKTAIAHILARKIDAVVLSADSMLVYRGMDIGTAKPTPQEREGIEYGGIDLADPDEPFSAGAWLAEAKKFLASFPPGKNIIVAGGTGLYFSSLVFGLDCPKLDEAAIARADSFFAEHGREYCVSFLNGQIPPGDVKNPRRIVAALARKFSGDVQTKQVRKVPHLCVLDPPRDVLRARISARIELMLEHGWIDEVRTLVEQYPLWSRTAETAIGYSEIKEALAQNSPVDAQKIAVRTSHLAKRQRTWFRNQSGPVQISVSGDAEKDAGAVLSVWEKYGPHEIDIDCD